MKIGVMFGSPETTSGGNALKFYASVRLDIRRVGAIKEAAAGGKDPAVIGNRTRVKVVKNKLAPPFGRSSSTSCTGKASATRGTFSILRPKPTSSKRAAPGSRSRGSASDKDARTRVPSSSNTPRFWTGSRRWCWQRTGILRGKNHVDGGDAKARSGNTKAPSDAPSGQRYPGEGSRPGRVGVGRQAVAANQVQLVVTTHASSLAEPVSLGTLPFDNALGTREEVVPSARADTRPRSPAAHPRGG